MDCFLSAYSYRDYHNGGTATKVTLFKSEVAAGVYFIDKIKQSNENDGDSHINFICSCKNKITCYEFVENIDNNICDIINVYNEKNYDHKYPEIKDDDYSDYKDSSKKILIKNCPKKDEDEDEEEDEDDKHQTEDEIKINKIHKTKSNIEYKKVLNDDKESNITKIIFITSTDFVNSFKNGDFFCKQCKDDIIHKDTPVGTNIKHLLNFESTLGYWIGPDSDSLRIDKIDLKLDEDVMYSSYKFQS